MTHPYSGGVLARFRKNRSGNGRLFHTLSKLVAGLGLAAVTASAGTATVPGVLNYEYFPNETRGSVEGGTAAPSIGYAANRAKGADANALITTFESETNFADNYANRVSGLFIPPTTGNYVFFVASDDDGDLFLSTDDSPANKKLIAQEAGWSGERKYLTVGGGSTAEDKRSDTFTKSQWAGATGAGATIKLTKGSKYYIEYVHHEGGGGDNVAVTYKLDTEPDPADNDAPRFATAEIAALVNTGTPTITLQPVGGTAYTGTPFSMFVQDGSNGQFPVLYQWQKNGTNIPGAIKATFAIGSASAADAGSYAVVVSAYNSTGGLTSVTSAPPAVVTVKNIAVEFVPGKLNYEYFPGKDRPSVENGTAGAPATAGGTVGSDNSGLIDIFESGTNFAEGYANRISGLFVPPTTGNYVFFIACDDDGDLFLSTDDSPSNKKLIAQESGWSGVRKYSTVGGGSSVDDKRSDTFTKSEWPGGTTIKLTKGSKYYIEAVHHEGGGGDNLAVTYKLDTDSDPADDDAPLLTGNVVGVNIPRIISLGFGGTTAKKLTFSVTDSGVSVLNPATVKASLDGSPVTATIGTKANGVTPFTVTYSSPLAFGSSHVYRIEASDTQGQPVAISAPFTVGTPYFPVADLPGQKAVDGAFGYEFIFGIKNASGNLVQVTSLPAILKMIQASGSPSFTTPAGSAGLNGVIVKGTSPTINWKSGGFLADDIPYPDDAVNDPLWTGEDFINLNVANINVPEEGDYTFGIHSDDGCAMRIRGATAIGVGGSGQLDPNDPEAVVEPADTGDSNTKGTYHLLKGIYRLEFFWWERGGGDFGEIYVAKGNFKADADTDTWLAVGDPASSIKLTSAAPTFPGTTPTGATATIAVSGGNVTITSSAAGTVQASDKLGTGANWQDVGTAPQTVPTTGKATRFFRIKQ